MLRFQIFNVKLVSVRQPQLYDIIYFAFHVIFCDILLFRSTKAPHDRHCNEWKRKGNTQNTLSSKWTQRCQVHCENVFHFQCERTLLKACYIKLLALDSTFFVYSSGPHCLRFSEVTLSHLLYLVLFWTSLLNEITAADKQPPGHLHAVLLHILWIVRYGFISFPWRSAPNQLDQISSEVNKPLFVCVQSIYNQIYLSIHWKDLRWLWPQHSKIPLDHLMVS